MPYNDQPQQQPLPPWANQQQQPPPQGQQPPAQPSPPRGQQAPMVPQNPAAVQQMGTAQAIAAMANPPGSTPAATGPAYQNPGAMLPQVPQGQPVPQTLAPGTASPEDLAQSYQRFLAAQPRPPVFHSAYDISSPSYNPDAAARDYQANQQNALNAYLQMTQNNQAQQKLGLDAYLGQGNLAVQQALANEQSQQGQYNRYSKNPLFQKIVEAGIAAGKSEAQIDKDVNTGRRVAPLEQDGVPVVPFPALAGQPGGNFPVQAAQPGPAANFPVRAAPTTPQPGPGVRPQIVADVTNGRPDYNKMFGNDVVLALENAYKNSADHTDAKDALQAVYNAIGGDRQITAQNLDPMIDMIAEKYGGMNPIRKALEINSRQWAVNRFKNKMWGRDDWEELQSKFRNARPDLVHRSFGN